MSREKPTVPRLMLGATSLDLPAFATRDRALEVAGRFREPESLAVSLVKALDAGAEAVYAAPSGTLFGALAELSRPVPIVARLPLTPPSEDLHDEPGLLRGAPESVPMNASTLASTWARLTAGELVARTVAHCELEAARLPMRARRGLAVAANVTDLALAAGNQRAFEQLLAYGRSRFGGLGGFETRNLGMLIERLRAWGLHPDFVIGAVNPRGFAMRPDGEAVLAALQRPGIAVIANELRAGGTVPLAEGGRFARSRGAWGLCPELIEIDDVSGEIRGLRPESAALAAR